MVLYYNHREGKEQKGKVRIMKKYMVVNSREMEAVNDIVERILVNSESTEEMMQIARMFESILVEDDTEVAPSIVEF